MTSVKMSLNETGKLIEETRKIIETGQDGPNNMDLLNMILKVVTNIDSRVQGMETKLDKRIDDLHQSMLSVSARVRTLETKTSEINVQLADCQASCQGVSNLFDDIQTRSEQILRKVIHHNGRITHLEQSPKEQLELPLNEINKLKDSILDLQCRSMKNNLIFKGLAFAKYENCEQKLQNFLYEELDIQHPIEFGNVHRFGKRSLNRARPIIARFLYHRDLEHVLKNANKLRGKPFGIQEQFPAEIEEERKRLYPIMKLAKQDGKLVKMFRDKLYIDGKLFIPRSNTENPTPQNQEPVPTEIQREGSGENTGYRDVLMTPSNDTQNGRYKRQRAGSSPETPH